MKGFLFWLASCTWGIVMSLFGFFVALGLLVSGHKPHIFHWYIYFEVGEHWGGFECGTIFVVNHGAGLSIKQHEAGHGLQNIMFGPLMPLIVSIPSAVRYWVRHFKIKKGLGATLPDYDSVWFEGMATRLGERYFDKTGRKPKLKIVK